MTNDEVWSAVVRWIASVSGVTVIRSHEGAKAPALPYVMANFTGMAQVRAHEQLIEYTPTGQTTPENKPEISAAPVIEAEWRFSVHAYGSEPTGILRPIVSASKVAQAMEPMFSALVIHDVSQIRNVPDWINNGWEPRAQLDLIVRGVTRDGFIVDTIDETSFDIARAE
ncbi:phage neck terminator protein [Rhizobium bangladeshense]|uniref:phage neck terminator protein n=1 Tax=Rhizobium bangladeshense TaxID=1138189 RepID=UPI001C82B272|nr:hypothetical protein [Rhizobium bangladeshense]MBX4889773.1 hypothetical protein [Rhizobium bangladeshense]